LWRSLPQSVRLGVGPALEFSVRRLVLGSGRGATAAAGQPGPLIVSNYGDLPSGLARGGRLTAAALRDQGLPVIEHDLRPALADRRIGRGTLVPEDRGGVWISHCNPEHIASVLSHLAPADWQGRYRIGYWAWELPRAPGFWFWMARFFHEVWVVSSFVAEALDGAPTAIRVMPHPVPLGPVAPLRNGPRIVLTMADLRSAQARKNPLGAIEAYRRAFPEPQPDRVRLRVKLNGMDFDPPALAALQAATQRPDIELIERVLSDQEMEALVGGCDLLLSLHRSEGFGLPIAEAMARGIPALATGWSGNLDFMRGLDPLLVAHGMTAVDDPSGVYVGRGMQWAEPDLDDAASRLRRLVADDALRRDLGAEGRRRIDALHTTWQPGPTAGTDWRSLIRPSQPHARA
jgi:glycosyltransferase involved in cell wall biosynthesis